jgi:hypothetical protein
MNTLVRHAAERLNRALVKYEPRTMIALIHGTPNADAAGVSVGTPEAIMQALAREAPEADASVMREALDEVASQPGHEGCLRTLVTWNNERAMYFVNLKPLGASKLS